MKNTIAIYCRTALKNKSQIKAQKNHSLQYVKESDRSNVKIYSDNGYSGLGYRPAFTKMLEDIKSGHIEMVITKDISRFTRNISDMMSIMDLLESHNVQLISLEEHAQNSLQGKEKSKIESIITTQYLAYLSEQTENLTKIL